MGQIILIPDNVNHILETLQQAGHEAFVVGGCVRDALLARTPGDWDITTDKKWGVDLGGKTEPNPYTGRLETTPIVMPYYNLNGQKLGFDFGGLLKSIIINQRMKKEGYGPMGPFGPMGPMGPMGPQRPKH